MRINILLILFVVFAIVPMNISANPVSGQYSLPTSSVRFEKLDRFSVLPVGWSKKGNAAFIIVNRIELGMKLVIIDTIEDNIIWISSVYTIDDVHNLLNIWNQNIDLFSNKLSESGIIPDLAPHYGGTVFTLDNDEFKLLTDEFQQAGAKGITSLSLKIISNTRGEKTLYKYIYSRTDNSVLVDFFVLGYFKSPWENRIITLSAEDYLNPSGEDIFQLRFSGAHLSLGYRRIVNKETQLIDAVLSGQFYNSRVLLNNGVKADCTVSSGEPLVLMAAKQFNWDLVFLLIDYGADFQGKDNRGRTLLHYGAISGDRDLCLSLLQKGIDRGVTDSDGETAYSLALRKGFAEVVALLK